MKNLAIRILFIIVTGLILISCSNKNNPVSPVNLTKPILSIPSNYSPDLSLFLILKWQNVEKATSYDVEVALDSLFGNKIDNITGVTDNSCLILNLDFGNIYYWRVKARANNSESEWSVPFSFTTQPKDALLNGNQLESQKAYLYLNLVRYGPPAFSSIMGVDLSSYAAMPALLWNDTLAKVAEAKSLDMATRNYFAHVDPDHHGINYLINKAGYKLNPAWLTDSTANNFESIAAAYYGDSLISGVDFINQLIIDQGVPDLGHRNHLLGVGAWFGSLKDIGIGIARNPNSTYRNYMCVVIAKHN